MSTTTAHGAEFSTERMQLFTLQLLSGLTATLTTVMIDVGVRTGALDGLAAGAATSAELAERTGLSKRHARFEVRDVTNLPHDAHFDVITAFDAIHDQVQPRTVLREVRRVLTDDGVFVMVDMNASSNLEDNIGNPVATYFYAVSLLHCMQVSLAAGGEGLGTAWGRQLATDLLQEAGFTSVRLIETPPEDPVNIIFEARP